MYVERIPNRNSPPASFCGRVIVTATRSAAHARQSVGLAGAKIEALAPRAARDAVASVGREALSMQRSLPHGHVAAALGTLRKLGLDRLLLQGGRSPSRKWRCASP